MRADRRTLAGISLVCFANLLLEVMITRLFSATMFYHFTFLAVALALFGVAASGVWVFVNEERLAGEVQAALARNARRFALATLVALVYALANPMDIIIVTGSNRIPQFAQRQFWQLVLLVGFTAAPFYFAGAVVSLALTFFGDSINRVYFWDLAGAAAAALVAGVAVALLGGPSVLIAVAALGLIAAALFDPGARDRAAAALHPLPRPPVVLAGGDPVLGAAHDRGGRRRLRLHARRPGPGLDRPRPTGAHRADHDPGRALRAGASTARPRCSAPSPPP
jgi:hypothetical protein